MGNGDADFDWDTDEEDQIVHTGPGSSKVLHNNTEAGPSQPSIISYFMQMGYTEQQVVKAIRDNGEENQNDILDTLLTYAAIEEEYPIKQEDSPNSCENQSDSNDEADDYRECQELRKGLVDKDQTIAILTEMGYRAEEAASAIERCGLDAPYLELSDSIIAARLSAQFGVQVRSSSSIYINDESNKHNKRRGQEMNRQGKKPMTSSSKGKKPVAKRDSITLPSPMIGFGLPFKPPHISHRDLPEAARGPPFFYYENVETASSGMWETISRALYNIKPEFVDSKYFSAAARERGYIHNLPITGRVPLLPIPPKTIFDAFPSTRTYWPKWDTRTQLNCLKTSKASPQCIQRISKTLNEERYPSPLNKDFVLRLCRQWNLIWVGHNKVAPLEPDEMEMLFGFPRDHTRGLTYTDRYKALGNSFQINTVAYHLSVLKNIFPNGMNVLSLFSGIGGAEVALHSLGIHLKTVVMVELKESNRNIVKGWWARTEQTGNLVDFADVWEVSEDSLKKVIREHGSFDLVIGGSACNHLDGSNQRTTNGFEGEQLVLFFQYFRILELVKRIMANNAE